uniref:Lipoprotein n=1 Tax=Escherichia coli TaxID=562 RepID=A0A2R4ABV1_ECOLX|nr:hypothetical protein [Escherichia coli]AVR62118.1 hypothetical protein p508-2_00052 [Escherichia coli]QJS03333.1 hypothetical protein G6844_00018 [Escherichia coli]
MKKQPLLWMTIAAALLSGCTGHREHHPQVTFTVDTVRTDTTASNPICLAENTEAFLMSAIRTCLPVLRGVFHAVHFLMTA